MVQKIQNNVHGAFKHTKGFTLVEVIVVLVILAILAAILVPKLTGWIDESKAKAAIGEGHLVLSALQADATEQYSITNTNPPFDVTTVKRVQQKYCEGDIKLGFSSTITIYDLPGAIAKGAYSAGAVIHFEYLASNKKIVTYHVPAEGARGKFTVNDIPK